MDDRRGWRRLWRSDIPWYRNFFFSNGWAAAFFFFVILSAIMYRHDVAQYRAVYERPCDYCASCRDVPFVGLNLSLNVSGDLDAVGLPQG